MEYIRMVRKFFFAAVMVAAIGAIAPAPNTIHAQGGCTPQGNPPCYEGTASCCRQICAWQADVCDQICGGTWMSDCSDVWNEQSQTCDLDSYCWY